MGQKALEFVISKGEVDSAVRQPHLLNNYLSVVCFFPSLGHSCGGTLQAFRVSFRRTQYNRLYFHCTEQLSVEEVRTADLW
jgi:hypothetical protein